MFFNAFVTKMTSQVTYWLIKTIDNSLTTWSRYWTNTFKFGFKTRTAFNSINKFQINNQRCKFQIINYFIQWCIISHCLNIQMTTTNRKLEMKNHHFSCWNEINWKVYSKFHVIRIMFFVGQRWSHPEIKVKTTNWLLCTLSEDIYTSGATALATPLPRFIM